MSALISKVSSSLGYVNGMAEKRKMVPWYDGSNSATIIQNFKLNLLSFLMPEYMKLLVIKSVTQLRGLRSKSEVVSIKIEVLIMIIRAIEFITNAYSMGRVNADFCYNVTFWLNNKDFITTWFS